MEDSTNKNSQLSTFDIIKIIIIVALALFLVYRSFLPFCAEYAFREAFNATARKNTSLAIAKYLKAKQLAPWETHYQIQLGKIYEDLARKSQDKEEKIKYIKKAESIYQDCINISPKNPWYQNRMAEIFNLYASIADTKKEKEQWQKKREDKILYAAKLDKNNALFQMAVAYLYHQKGDYDKAMEKYSHVLEIDDTFAEAYFNMADIYRRTGKQEKQIEMYKKIFEKKPTFKNAHLQLGRIYESKGMLKKAIMEYIEEVKIDKKNITAYEVLGAAFYRNKNWGNAAKIYHRLTMLQPNNPRFYLLQAQSLAKIGQLQQALVSLESAQTLMPDNKEIKQNIARLKNIMNPPKSQPKATAATINSQ